MRAGPGGYDTITVHTIITIILQWREGGTESGVNGNGNGLKISLVIRSRGSPSPRDENKRESAAFILSSSGTFNKAASDLPTVSCSDPHRSRTHGHSH